MRIVLLEAAFTIPSLEYESISSVSLDMEEFLKMSVCYARVEEPDTSQHLGENCCR